MSVEKILDEYAEQNANAAQNLKSELMKDCKTFADVDRNLRHLKWSIRWNDGNKYENLLKDVEQLIEKEKNDLPLTNRSE